MVGLHHPDGGFRRLTRRSGERQVAPLDGAETAGDAGGEGDEPVISPICADRYRIPVTR